MHESNDKSNASEREPKHNINISGSKSGKINEANTVLVWVGAGEKENCAYSVGAMSIVTGWE